MKHIPILLALLIMSCAKPKPKKPCPLYLCPGFGLVDIRLKNVWMQEGDVPDTYTRHIHKWQKTYGAISTVDSTTIFITSGQDQSPAYGDSTTLKKLTFYKNEYEHIGTMTTSGHILFTKAYGLSENEEIICIRQLYGDSTIISFKKGNLYMVNDSTFTFKMPLKIW